MARISDPSLLAQLGDGDNPAATLVGSGMIAGPTGRSMSTPAGQALAAAALKSNPNYDGTTFARRQKTAAAFAAGPEAANMTALNTAIGHMQNLRQSSDALNNTGIPAFNWVANHAIAATGDPRPNRFGLDQQAVADELEKVFTGTRGGTESGRKGWQGKFSPNDSPAQLHANIAEAARLLGSRVDSLVHQYQQGTGTKNLPPNLTPEHFKALKELQALDGDASAAKALPPGVVSMKRIK